MDAATLRRILEANNARLIPSVICTVVSYDANTERATLRPQVKALLPAEENQEATVTEALPDIPDVPIVFQRGGGCFIKFPLQEGDGVLLVLGAMDPFPWLENETAGEPEDHRHNSLSFGFGIPGPVAKSKVSVNVPNALVLDGPVIKAGANAGDKVVTENRLAVDLGKIAFDLDAFGTALGIPATYTYAGGIGSPKLETE